MSGEEREPAPELRALDVDYCGEFAEDDARACYSREFLAMVDGVEDPRPAVARITDAARSEGGFLLENCHVVMHTVGRTYADDAGRLAGHAHELPAGRQRPRLPGRVRARAGHRRRPGHRPGRAARGGSGLRRCGHALPALQLRPRVRARVHAPVRGQARAGVEALHGARVAVGGRLRAGRVPRLLVRRRRRRRGLAPERRDHRPVPAVRRPAGGLRAAVLVPGVPGEPPGGLPGREPPGHRGPVRRARGTPA